MKLVSIVTVSYNQGDFLERTINSVLSQTYKHIEYIVVDACSTDNSHVILDRYRSRLSELVVEPDKGAADGLNKGFRISKGSILGFLNSDDTLLPNAIEEAVDALDSSGADVVSGHGLVLDGQDRVLRRVFSDKFSLPMYAYSACTLVQPSTFFKRAAFLKTGGFNIENRSNWDGELWVDMAIAGFKFGLCDRLWSGYRLHDESITSSGRLDQKIHEHHEAMFRRIMGRPKGRIDRTLQFPLRAVKHFTSPRATLERIMHGAVYRRKSS